MAAALVAALVVGAVGGCAREPVARSAHILLRGNGPEPDSLDPQKARSVEAHVVLRDLYECLTSLAKDASTAPGVAKSWEASPDGLTYTFHLRDNALWSNGDRVTGDDFVFALRRLVDLTTASRRQADRCGENAPSSWQPRGPRHWRRCTRRRHGGACRARVVPAGPAVVSLHLSCIVLRRA